MALLRKYLSPPVVYTIEHLLPSKRAHKKRMIEHYKQFIKSGDLVFDIGANLGERTKVFRAIGAKVIAVEPTNYCVHYLRALFDKDPDVTVLPVALGQKDGVGEININEKLPVLSTMSNKWINNSRFSNTNTWDKKETISITTLDSLIEKYGRPTFCKIDVEGFEYEVISGLSSSIPILSFEFMYEFIDDTKKIVDRIKTLYNAEYNFNIGEEMDLFQKHWSEPNILFKSLQDRNDVTLWGDIYVREVR